MILVWLWLLMFFSWFWFGYDCSWSSVILLRCWSFLPWPCLGYDRWLLFFASPLVLLTNPALRPPQRGVGGTRALAHSIFRIKMNKKDCSRSVPIRNVPLHREDSSAAVKILCLIPNVILSIKMPINLSQLVPMGGLFIAFAKMPCVVKLLEEVHAAPDAYLMSWHELTHDCLNSQRILRQLRQLHISQASNGKLLSGRSRTSSFHRPARSARCQHRVFSRTFHSLPQVNELWKAARLIKIDQEAGTESWFQT